MMYLLSMIQSTIQKKRPTPHTQNERATLAIPPPCSGPGGSEYDNKFHQRRAQICAQSCGHCGLFISAAGATSTTATAVPAAAEGGGRMLAL